MLCVFYSVILSMACVVCLDGDEVRDFKSHYGCSCAIVPFHEECWTLYDRNFKSCPLCRKKIELEIMIHPHPTNREENLQAPPNQQSAFTRSQFITNHPYWNAFFSLFICGYSGLTATLFMFGLYKYYSQLDTYDLIHSFIFIIFNVYDVISVILDQFVGVLWFIQEVLIKSRLWNFWIVGFYLLVLSRYLLSISCIILISFLYSNSWTQSGYILVSLQGLFMTIIGICFCCK
jgi:hypothetical protein